jgi:hypothetical protein
MATVESLLARTTAADTGCLLWEGARGGNGYGYVRLDGRTVAVHRLVVALDGRDPTGQVVRHTCDNPACVNPEHLVLGSQADNVADMMQRGRHRPVERVTVCANGHEYERSPSGRRGCLACHREREAQRRRGNARPEAEVVR